MTVASLPLDRAPSAADIGFRIGPRVNAAGRMDIADNVIELFLTRSPERAWELATKLNDLNEARRATERQALDTIEQHLLSLVEPGGSYPAECLILDHPDWHRGVLGILASRVVERTGRPALVLTHQDGEAHGSGRSIEGFHLLDSLTEVHTTDDSLGPNLFTRFGGHAHAVGLSLPAQRLPNLRERMGRVSAGRLPPTLLRPVLLCEAEIRLEDLDSDLTTWIDHCAPFGNSHSEPIFLIRLATLLEAPRVIQGRHICLTFETRADRPAVRAMGWSRSKDWVAISQSLKLTTGTSLDLASRIRWKSTAWFTGVELDLVDARTLNKGPGAPFYASSES